jgi:deoxycytidine triphosphate deaminase
MQWTGKMIAEKIIIEGKPVKVNPNGVDIAPSEIWRIPEDGVAKIHGAVREINPEKELIKPINGMYILPRGVYEVRLNCKVRIPHNAAGFCHPRSTLSRFGILKAETAVWDSGYEGFGTVTFWVSVRETQVHEGEAWVQFTVRDSYETQELYQGHWQGEGVRR